MKRRPHLWEMKGYLLIPHKDALEWARYFETADRRIGWTEVTPDVVVSTVFLGLDHNYSPHGPAILFETMVRGLLEANIWDMQERYATRHQAEQGHELMVRRVQAIVNRRAQENTTKEGK